MVAAKTPRSRPTSHDGWLSTFVKGVFGASAQTQPPANNNPNSGYLSTDESRNRGRSPKAKRAVTTPYRLAHPSQSRGLPAAPVIKHESVICRSTPASRSSSVVRGGAGNVSNASRNAPLLSPAEIDSDISVPHRGDCTLMWTLEQRMRRQLSQSVDPEDENDDPNLERILSSYISARSPSPSSKTHSFSHTSYRHLLHRMLMETIRPLNAPDRSIRSENTSRRVPRDPNRPSRRCCGPLRRLSARSVIVVRVTIGIQS